VDLKNIRTKSLRQNIGIVTQEPYLFSGTLKENILMAKDSADGEVLADVVTAAALTETVAKFTDGYETVVGEGGVTLSGGQKQRVAIARALLTDAPIMVFDDSLSAVDTETDNRIRRAISERFGKATVILISHRVSTVSAADHIIVLDGGRISEHGTHDELRRAGGIYRRIYELQNMREEDGNDA
jgi:ATP-binding cassette subfamily B protein